MPRTKKIILILIIIMLGLFVIYNNQEINKGTININQELTKKESAQEPAITITIGDENKKLKIKTGQSLYEALTDKDNYGLIRLEGRNYSGLGFLVTDIDNLHSGKGKYLFYSINGKESSVGISSYVPQNGDIIKWTLK